MSIKLCDFGTFESAVVVIDSGEVVELLLFGSIVTRLLCFDRSDDDVGSNL